MCDFSHGPSLVIYGHAGFDISVVAGKYIKTIGGAAYYAALAASLLNCCVGVVTVIGNDFPLAELQSLQIDTSGILLREGDSAVFYQEYGNGNEVICFRGQLNVCEELSPLLIPAHYLGTGIFFIVSSPPRQQAQVLDWLRRKEFEGIIAIDTTLAYVSDFRSLLSEFTDRIDIVFVNAQEYRALCWLPPDSISIVVKRGADGASLFEKGVWTDVPAPEIDEVCSTTGAGDILAGACLAGVAAGSGLKTALSKGVELATKSVGGSCVAHLRRMV